MLNITASGKMERHNVITSHLPILSELVHRIFNCGKIQHISLNAATLSNSWYTDCLSTSSYMGATKS